MHKKVGMSNPAPIRKILTITLLPIITFIWIIGWTLTQIGTQNQKQVKVIQPQTNKKQEKKIAITLTK